MSSNLRRISRRRMPRIAPLRKTFSRPVSSGWKPVPTSSSEPTRPLMPARPSVGSVIRERILSSVRLAGAVAADNADHLALVDLERDVAERPASKLLGRRAAALQAHRGARRRPRSIRSDGRIAPARRRSGSASPSLSVLTATWFISDHVGECPLHAPEVEQARSEQERDHSEARPIRTCRAPTERRAAPSESRRSRLPSG